MPTKKTQDRTAALKNAPPDGFEAATARPNPDLSPADVILDIAKQFDDQSGAGVIGRELLRAGPVYGPVEAARSSGVLMEAGLVDEAEALFHAMVQSFPRHPGGLVGLAQVTMRRKDWPDALQRWDSILKSFEGRRNAFWLSARAVVLFELGRAQEAVEICDELIHDFPDQPAGYVGLARLALRQCFWQEALIRCDEILARFGDQAGTDSWSVMRANALLELGRADEAEAILRDIAARAPGSLSALTRLLQVYMTTGRPEAAWRALDSSPFGRLESSSLVERRFDILIRLKRFDEADAYFARVLGCARRPDMLGSLFAFVPALYEGHERQRIWRVLLERATGTRSSSEGLDRVSLGVLTARIQLALRDLGGVGRTMQHLAECPHLGEHGEALRRVAAVLSSPKYPDYEKPKIFGIGLSKTGTTTLAAALMLLGFSTLDWSNPLTRELISDDDLPNFDAFTDIPVSVRFEYFYYLYPNSKFILTVRPFDSWVKSISSHWHRNLGMSDFDRSKAAMEEPRAFHYGTQFRDICRSLYFNYENYREAFEAHGRRVRRFFRDKPADRFLELNIFGGDGWPKLCAFVGREAPSAPFPWRNRKPAGP